MKIKDLISANENVSVINLEIFQNGNQLVYKGSANEIYNIMQDWEIDTIISRGGQTYKEVYVK